MKKLTLFLLILTSIFFAISVQAQVGPEQASSRLTSTAFCAPLTQPLLAVRAVAARHTLSVLKMAMCFGRRCE